MEQALVTTFNKDLFKKYAYSLLKSYDEYKIPFPLYIFCEDGYKVQGDNVACFDLYEHEPECKKFVDRNRRRPVTGFHLDAVRFCYKVFAQNAVRKFADRIFYIDSDSVIKGKWDLALLDRLLPQNKFVSFYDRPKLYTETGFLGFDNRNKELADDFFNHYLQYYIDDSVYELEAYTDCHTFDATRKMFADRAGYHEHKLGDGENMHIMARCPIINPYLDHRKGRRKERPQSPEWITARQV